MKTQQITDRRAAERVALRLSEIAEVERLTDEDLVDAVEMEVWLGLEPGSRSEFLTTELLSRYTSRLAVDHGSTQVMEVA